MALFQALEEMKARGLIAIRLLCLFFLLAGISGCMRLSEGKPPGPWYDAYLPIEDPDSNAFIVQTLEKASAEFGEPLIPVNKVLLRRSRKAPEALRFRLAEDFSLTQCVDPTNGIFVIYIGVDPDDRNYHALLGHECAHLLNPYITDWYMEGIATVFSEQACEAAGMEWGNWKRHFTRSRRLPYALSYRMMLELQEAIPSAYPLLMQYTAPAKRKGDWLRIDIDAWLAALPEADRSEALRIIEPFSDSLRRNVSAQYEFEVPEALK
jgi:hypothetical protein